MPGLFGQFNLDRSLGLLLADGCPFGTIAIWSNVLDFQRNEIAASQFAVDGQIEQRRSRVRWSI